MQMTDATSSWPNGDATGDDTAAFYRHVLDTLTAQGVPALVGGAYAFACYTGIRRDTKDFDLFLRREDVERALAALGSAGYRAELVYPHWLAKVHAGDAFVDLIFNSGNGAAPVDDRWFADAVVGQALGVPVQLQPAEEMIWSKAFVMERERYDGADVAHLLRALGDRLDWPRLLRRFGPHWRVLLAHLVLYGFVYPGERARVPAAVVDDLIDRLRREAASPGPRVKVCGGTLLSREQYLHDIEQLGYRDARLAPIGHMSADEIAAWTAATLVQQESRAAGS
jgi:hypothetical protein